VKDSVIEIDIDSDVEISPVVAVSKLSVDSWNFLSFQKYALGNTRVLNFGLCDVNCLIGKVIVNRDFSDSVVFKSTFYNMFLEKCIKSQYFSIMFEPWRLYSRDVIVFRCFSVLQKG